MKQSKMIQITWWCHQMETFSVLLAFVQGIHRWMNSPHKGQWCRALMFSLSFLWVNNGEAGDLGHHCAHYDVIVMNVSPGDAIWHHGTLSVAIFVTVTQVLFSRYNAIIPAKPCGIWLQWSWYKLLKKSIHISQRIKSYPPPPPLLMPRPFTIAPVPLLQFFSANQYELAFVAQRTAPYWFELLRISSLLLSY